MNDEQLDDEGLPFPALDRTQFAVFSSFEEAAADMRAYWLSRSAEDRLRQARYLQWMNYGHDAITQRLVRVLEVVEQAWC